nr:immunoglobulin light chain junction region [Macaca mulatta]MOV65865.1 immunoglobulin light chain junction region [Macaca mulatta]MOV65955.1 immunoglobulin light chain junction region [Macaca mulatta]MOV65986.1 immunoglobulin light chain junction region [Macaca mulatta]MOV66051.1 immunoglobulin light chain junction region [Macaca mulatta]
DYYCQVFDSSAVLF